MYGAFPSKACLKRAYDSMFEPNPEYFKLIKELKRREVRKNMAIDYKKEWKLLQQIYGKYTIQDKRGIPSISTTLDEVMNFQIERTISNREKLMQEYLGTERLQTDITGGTPTCYNVLIIIAGDKRGTISVSKKAFDAWCKKKEGR